MSNVLCPLMVNLVNCIFRMTQRIQVYLYGWTQTLGLYFISMP